MVGGLLQMWQPYIPIYCFGCLILMLLFYIQSIEQRISVDPLTNLNNRGQLMRYVSQPNNLRMEGRLTCVIMMDIDSFKTINDTYGHAEGDAALVMVANALKRAVGRFGMPTFLGRYGGDEFVLIIHPTEMGEADRLIREIRNEVKRQSDQLDYPLTVSIGCDDLGDVDDNIQSCIRRADKKLYQEKDAKKHPHA